MKKKQNTKLDFFYSTPFIFFLFLRCLSLIGLHCCVQVLVVKRIWSWHVVQIALVKTQLIKRPFLHTKLVQGDFLKTKLTICVLHILQALAQAILSWKINSYEVLQNCCFYTWMADIAATIAGVPNPCVIIEKCVRCRCIFWSMIGWGRVLHNGDRSWFRRSINSLQTNLRSSSNKNVLCLVTYLAAMIRSFLL